MGVNETPFVSICISSIINEIWVSVQLLSNEFSSLETEVSFFF
jgi:hypothetical protein